MAKSLRQGKRLDFSAFEPTLIMAQVHLPPNATAEMIEAAEVTRKHQQEANNSKLQTDCKICKEREQECNDIVNQLFSLIMTVFCSKTLAHRIEQHPECKTKIQDDPMASLEAIKTLMHDPVGAQCPIVSACTAQ